MWDLIHDRTHMHGDLPFDPFMIKQRMPFFLYSLEELRCDLTAFREAVRLEAAGRRRTPGSCSTRSSSTGIFRFPITGDRVRNYDGLGGQLLFAWLHQHRRAALDRQPAAPSTGTRLPDAVLELGDRDRGAVLARHRPAQDRPLAGRLRAGLRLRRHRTRRRSGRRAPRRCRWTGRPKGLTDAVLPDEFPLSMFYEALRKKLRRRDRRHLRDHRHEYGDGPVQPAQVAGRVVVGAPARPAPAGPPLRGPAGRRRRDRRGRRRQRRAARAGGRAGQRRCRGRWHRARRGRGPARRAGHPRLGRPGAGRVRPGRRPGAPRRRLARRRSPSPRPTWRTGTLLQDLLIRTLQHTSLAFHDALQGSDDARLRARSRRRRRRHRRRRTPPTPRPRPPPRPGPWRWQTRSRGSNAAAVILLIKALLTPAMREAKPDAKFPGYTDVTTLADTILDLWRPRPPS